MIEVRICHEDDDQESRFLMTWPSDDLDRVVPMIEGWGIQGFAAEDIALWGRFVVNDTDAFFEVVISPA